jgi:hypothetical protein
MKFAFPVILMLLAAAGSAAAQQTDDQTGDYEEQDRRYLERYVRPGEPEEEELPEDPEERAAAYLAKADELIRDPSYRSAASDRYRVQTDDPGTNPKAAVQLLESFRDFFDAFWKGRTELAPYEKQSRVFLFFSFHKFNQLLGGNWKFRITRPAGHYRKTVDVITLHTEPDGRAHMADSLVHEAAHQLIEQRVYSGDHRSALWIAEGLASYFGYTYMDRDHVFHPGEIGGKAESLELGKSRPGASEARTVLKAVRRYSKSVREDDDLRFVRVISIDDPGVFYGSAAAVHYASSWLVVHFLIHGDDGEHRDDFFRYLERDSRGEANAKALFTEIRMSPRGLDDAVAAHLKTLKAR